MTDDTEKPRRAVVARRSLTLGALAATMAAGSAAQAAVMVPTGGDTPGWFHLASGEGEGEGEGEGAAALDPDLVYLRDLSFIEGHLRAGLALYQAGDLAAAKTHMGHPIKEKYDAVADRVASDGHAALKAQIVALAQAAEAEERAEDLTAQFGDVQAVLDQLRGAYDVKTQIAALIALTRVAGDEYTVATKGGTIANLHEYQDAWGFMQVVSDEIAGFAKSQNDNVVNVAEKLSGYLPATGAVFGDLQGKGDFTLDAGVLYGAAARMELAAARLR